FSRDWSSDVCSSDLSAGIAKLGEPGDETVDIRGGEPVMTAVTADEDGDARPGKAGNLGKGGTACRRKAIGGKAVGRGQRHQHVVPAQSVVSLDPDQVGDSRTGNGILEEDGEDAGPAQAADIRHGAAAGANGDVGKRRSKRAIRCPRFARIDRAPR